MKKQLKLVLYFFVVIMYLELWHKYFFYPQVWNLGLVYTIFFSLLLSFLFALLSSLSNPKTNRIIVITIITILTLIFAGNYIYTTLFSVPFSIQVTSMAGQAFEFVTIFIRAIFKNFANIVILCFPLLITIIRRKKINCEKIFYFEKKVMIISCLILYTFSLIILLPFKNQDKSAFKLYWKQNDLIRAIDTFGFITAERLEIQRAILGFKETLSFEEIDNTNETTKSYNKMEIDFDNLIANEKSESTKSVYSFFKNTTATKKNEYTGIYQGKNLIFILAESFNSVVVSEEYTPNLYKLINSGFHFSNFYSPTFLSTTGGEFQAMTGLVPSAETLNEWHKGKAYLPFAIGNIFGKEDYTTKAFHNWNFEYYNRNNTMPEMGFEDFLACDNGLEQIADCYWNSINAPEDSQLIAKTMKEYVNEDKFATFYITMSGHSPYIFDSTKRNYEIVKDLPYSEETRAYIASQIDLDNAIATLLENLEEEGVLEDTVICLVGDHYPYAMDISNINEMSSYPRDELFEVNHSDLVIWNKNQETVEINKVGSQIDILPTILNLFGLEYDSRLMIGKDLLSDAEGIAIFSDLSWITDSGYYISKSNKFTATKDNVSSNYASSINQWVNNSVIVSKRIIIDDIYAKIFERNGEE